MSTLNKIELKKTFLIKLGQTMYANQVFKNNYMKPWFFF